MSDEQTNYVLPKLRPIHVPVRAKTYVISTAILFALRAAIASYVSQDVASGLGSAIGSLLWGVVPAGVYWLMAGRVVPDGKGRAARVMFWGSFVVPYALQSCTRQQP